MPTKIDDILSRMTIDEKLGQMILASIEVSQMNDATREFLCANHIGNVILFGKNCAGRENLARLNTEIQAAIQTATGLPALIAIDQEGGCVTRLRSEATVFPSAMVVARTGDADNAYRVGRIMGDELRALGINLDLAPVLDTLTGSAERRYYGTTTNDAAQYGCAMARGLRDAGVLACGKHFPGHEQTGLDTHFGFVVDDTPSDVLMRCMTPFRRAMAEELASVMIAHVCYPALDASGMPASLSKPIITNTLRGKLNFNGLVISDGLQMHAIVDRYGAPQGAVLAALAGCDLLITGNKHPASGHCELRWKMAHCRCKSWTQPCGAFWPASWRWTGPCRIPKSPCRIGSNTPLLPMRWPTPVSRFATRKVCCRCRRGRCSSRGRPAQASA